MPERVCWFKSSPQHYRNSFLDNYLNELPIIVANSFSRLLTNSYNTRTISADWRLKVYRFRGATIHKALNSLAEVKIVVTDLVDNQEELGKYWNYADGPYGPSEEESRSRNETH